MMADAAIARRARQVAETQFDRLALAEKLNQVLCRTVRDTGGVVPQAVGALAALRLDFGAVDVITDGESMSYILEVNTAPGLINETAEWYASRFADILGVELAS